MKNIFFLFAIFAFVSCKQEVTESKTTIEPWAPYDETEEIIANADHPSIRLQYKLIQSKNIDKNDWWDIIEPQIAYFSEEDYQNLKPLIFEQDIPTLQNHVKSGKLTYEKLTQWYLYRIVTYENNKDTYLNNIISINPNAVEQAKALDQNKSDQDHPIYGIPIFLKDNINTKGLPTTAGAYALKDNDGPNAFITNRIIEKGGLIIGKSSLSEWANFNCLGCPNGFSAMGGQTLNPYGRKKFDTGGSSSGSGSTIAANYAAVAVGTETSGSILSPSSSSSLVGLKPTIGLLSRGGIVPISSTLDTPGPMTKNVIDNAILLSAMAGEDPRDNATKDNPKNIPYWESLTGSETLKGLRFGVNKSFLNDSIYKATVETLKRLGAITIEFEPTQVDFNGFGRILTADMKIDLPNYIKDYTSDNITYKSVAEIIEFNKIDSLKKIPYGQGRIAQVVTENITEDELNALKERIHNAGVQFFETPMKAHQLDAILTINNRNAGFAAAAQYPCLTIPMGYRSSGQPAGLTFVARPFEEDKLLKMAMAFEKATKVRIPPKNYQ